MWRVPILAAASLLPERWRRRAGLEDAPLALPALLSGILQVVVSLVLGVEGFSSHRAANALPGALNPGEQMLFSLPAYLGFVFFSWQGLLALSLFIEGLVRGTAAATGAPCGSSLLFLADRALAGLEAWRRARAEAPLVADQVVHADGGLEVHSCRPREWDELTTLRIDGADHRVVRAGRRADPARPFVYGLEPTPPGWLLRRVVTYAPDDVLRWTPPVHARREGSKTRYAGGR